LDKHQKVYTSGDHEVDGRLGIKILIAKRLSAKTPSRTAPKSNLATPSISIDFAKPGIPALQGWEYFKFYPKRTRPRASMWSALRGLHPFKLEDANRHNVSDRIRQVPIWMRRVACATKPGRNSMNLNIIFRGVGEVYHMHLLVRRASWV